MPPYSLLDLKRDDEAFDELSALFKDEPSPVLANALGVVQLRRGDGAHGGQPAYFFTQAADANPSNADYLFNLGYAYALVHDPSRRCTGSGRPSAWMPPTATFTSC